MSRFVTVTLVVFLTVTGLRAQGPSELSFQGVLSDSSGAYADEPTVKMVFRIYEDGEETWSETHPAVDLHHGVFDVRLGSRNSLSGFAFRSPFELGITVGDDAEVTPRTKLTSAAYARALPWLYTFERDTGTSFAVNVVAGSETNEVGSDATGVTISGGGTAEWAPYEQLAYPNRVLDDFGTVGGGLGNTVRAKHGTIGGGYENTIFTDGGAVVGGYSNGVSGQGGFVGAGFGNRAQGHAGVVVGGSGNTAYGVWSVVGGGTDNGALGSDATIAGGNSNGGAGDQSFIGGGRLNWAIGRQSTIGGGESNETRGLRAAVLGGFSNVARGQVSSIGGGNSNVANGIAATIPGGSENAAHGGYALAAGRRARALHTGAFVWADATDADFESTADNQFLIRASGGVGINRNETQYPIQIGTNLTNGNGAYLSATGVWRTASSRVWKTGFTKVDGHAVLNTLAGLPITRWTYKTEPNVDHIGPVAEDFSAAFGLGGDDRYIGTVDADGVALAAIQALFEIVQKQQEEIENLKARLSEH